MTEDEQLDLRLLERAPRCPRCSILVRLELSMLDPRAGKRVRLYKCLQCDDYVWDDEGPRVPSSSGAPAPGER